MGLLLDTKDSYGASLNEVLMVPVPEKTDTYQPVSNRDLLDLIDERSDKLVGLPVKRREFGLSQKGQQMFGTYTFDVGDGDRGLSIGFRNSYNKTLSVGVVTGASVFVCSNLCFSGDAFKVVKKHTLNVWRSVTDVIDGAILTAADNYRALDADFSAWKSVEIKEMRGAEIIGRALYDGVLAPQQATIAMGDWRTPRHDEFSERTAWSIYNCFTEAVKKGPAGAQINRSTKVHDWFREQHAQAWRIAA